MKALLEAARQQHNAENNVIGRWYKIAMTPNLQSGDRFNVGVVFCDIEGALHYRFLAHYARLRCLYGDAIEEQTRFLLQLLREQLVNEESLLALPSYNINVEGPFHAAGANIDAILNNLYDTVIPIGRAPENKEQREESAFQALTNQKARGLIYEQLDHLHGLHKTHALIAETDYLEIDTPTGKRRLDIPLQPIGHYGSIISACYKNPASVEKHILNAQLDLNTADRLKPRPGQIGLFILRPRADMHLTAKEMDATDNVLDKLLWKMRDKHWLIEADDSPKRLAEEIAEWSAA
ncbi:DUF3037 domain-containing protein [Methylomonas rapida]|uniref:DUF3037 domain-containing protein n=1 Tax=Methylomonas rapida TaxID=2963939 RepID=A0ABY7GR11_9GAMM|nr:DUF3037 domain-containing protein [Methylomonas rapida]WAR46934.1 DUF3037 domain-containing protein [Methylomonas rapida]